MDEFVIFGGLRYQLKSNYTASICDSLHTEENIYIPRSIFYNSHEYIITKINEHSFLNNKIVQSIRFAEDTCIRSIEAKAFSASSLKSITFPASVEKLTNWSLWPSEIVHISISPENKNYMTFGDSMIIGKSDPKSDTFDSLLFACKNLKTVKIPPFIKYINSNSFSYCKNLQKIEFTEDSELLVIEKNAFFISTIESIYIPQNADLKDGWCKYTSNLIDVTISPLNKNLCYLDDDKKIILGKSNSNQDEFDVIVFGSRNIKEVKIPSFIKRVYSGAFSNCCLLKNVVIPNDSQLQSLGDNSFFRTLISSIFIPIHVKTIEDSAFNDCDELETIQFDPNSELEIIEKYSFTGSYLFGQICIPKHVKLIKDYAFNQCEYLSSVYFHEDCEIEVIGEGSFASTNITSILIPKSVKEISSDAFYDCKFLSTINFEMNSQLELIECSAFALTNIKEITIPKNVKSIGKRAFFRCSQLEKVLFEKGSQLHSIGQYIFEGTYLDIFQFPDSLVDLQDGWCHGTDSLSMIVVSPTNKHFSFIDQKMIVRKNENTDSYDTLVFASRDIEELNVPSFIRCIAPYAFSVTSSLLRIEFTEDSQLSSIKRNAFDSSAIEAFRIPANVCELENGWCYSTECLINVSISPQNKNFAFLPDQQKVMVSKSNRDLTFFDSIEFACRDIENVFIPDYIRYIHSAAFSECHDLMCIEFSEDSELELINDHSFSFTSIHNILIPKKVKKINSMSFAGCYFLHSFEALALDFTFGDSAFDNCTELKIISLPNCIRVHNLKEISSTYKKSKDFCLFVCTGAVFD